MKSTATKLIDSPEEFPCLLINTEGKFVVLACHRSVEDSAFTGVVVHKHDASSPSIGYYSNTWNRVAFLPFHGSVTLSNK